jgi:hypothetical protein
MRSGSASASTMAVAREVGDRHLGGGNQVVVLLADARRKQVGGELRQLAGADAANRRLTM